MIVKELIKALQTVDQDLEVLGYINEELGVIEELQIRAPETVYTKSGYIPEDLSEEVTCLFLKGE